MSPKLPLMRAQRPYWPGLCYPGLDCIVSRIGDKYYFSFNIYPHIIFSVAPLFSSYLLRI